MLKVGKYTLGSHLFLGTGKFSSNQVMREAIVASHSELVTVALKRISVQDAADDMLASLRATGVYILPNTSGARNAEEAVFAARMAREALGTDLIKLEIHPDPRYLLPDGEETLKASAVLAKEGFTVLPYVSADPVLCKKLEDVGVAAVMPLGAPIGSNRGLLTRDFLRIIIEESSVPVVVDAGIGAPSHACEAMEMGASAVLVNTAIAVANDPIAMAHAFANTVESGRMARDAGLATSLSMGMGAEASSPLTSFLNEFSVETR